MLNVSNRGIEDVTGLFETIEANKTLLELPRKEMPKVLNLPVTWHEVELSLSQVAGLQIGVCTRSAERDDPSLAIFNTLKTVRVESIAMQLEMLRQHTLPSVREWVVSIDEELRDRCRNGDIPPIFVVTHPLFNFGNIPDGNHRALALIDSMAGFSGDLSLNALVAQIPPSLWLSWNITAFLLGYLKNPHSSIQLFRARMREYTPLRI